MQGTTTLPDRFSTIANNTSEGKSFAIEEHTYFPFINIFTKMPIGVANLDVQHYNSIQQTTKKHRSFAVR